MKARRSVTYEKVLGVQWCTAHDGIIDECSDRDGVCDLFDGDHKCVVRVLWIQRRPK